MALMDQLPFVVSISELMTQDEADILLTSHEDSFEYCETKYFYDITLDYRGNDLITSLVDKMIDNKEINEEKSCSITNVGPVGGNRIYWFFFNNQKNFKVMMN